MTRMKGSSLLASASSLPTSWQLEKLNLFIKPCGLQYEVLIIPSDSASLFMRCRNDLVGDSFFFFAMPNSSLTGTDPEGVSWGTETGAKHTGDKASSEPSLSLCESLPARQVWSYLATTMGVWSTLPRFSAIDCAASFPEGNIKPE